MGADQHSSFSPKGPRFDSPLLQKFILIFPRFIDGVVRGKGQRLENIDRTHLVLAATCNLKHFIKPASPQAAQLGIFLANFYSVRRDAPL